MVVRQKDEDEVGFDREKNDVDGLVANNKASPTQTSGTCVTDVRVRGIGWLTVNTHTQRHLRRQHAKRRGSQQSMSLGDECDVTDVIQVKVCGSYLAVAVGSPTGIKPRNDWPFNMAAIVPTHERECALCTKDFKTPKILPCGHLLCRQCVISWMDSRSNAGCPLCTCPIVDHPGNLFRSSVDVVDALPTEYVMEAVVESVRVRVRDDMCTVCNAVRAVSICMQCLEKMCPSCMEIHKKMVATRSHDVESLSTVTPERLAASRPALCADHGDKPAELFCVRHNLVICTLCGCNKHSDCPEVRYVDDQMMYAEKELDLLKEKFAKVEDNLKQEIGKLTLRINMADATEQEHTALVDKTCDRLQKMIEERRKEQKKLISDSFSKNKKCLCDAKTKLEKRLGKVTSHKHIVTRATTVRPRPALIHSHQALTDRVKGLDLRHEMEAIPWDNPSPKLTKCCDDVVKQIQAELQSMIQQRANVESRHDSASTLPSVNLHFEMPQEALRATQVLVFHENCGTNIRLTNYNTTARLVRRSLSFNSVVVSRDAMAVNVLYEVRIDEIDGRNRILLGVSGVSPEQFTFTTWTGDLQKSVIIWDMGVRCNGDLFLQTNSNVCNALKSVKVGSRIGVLVDSLYDLHLYVDGQDQGVAARCVSQPCFAVFDLGLVIQLTALPTSRRT